MTGYPGRGLHGVIVEKIGGRIVRGEYGTGELLHADTLEREFGASKTAVREARPSGHPGDARIVS